MSAYTETWGITACSSGHREMRTLVSVDTGPARNCTRCGRPLDTIQHRADVTIERLMDRRTGAMVETVIGRA